MNEAPSGLAPTGVVGLDHILAGGFIRNRLYLIEGVPGSGKTTAALQFLRDGASRGEPMLYVTLSETEHELRTAAYSHGWDLQGITIHELMPSEQSLDREQQLSMFHPAEVELNTTTNAILAAVERVKPLRIVLDSLSEMRLLAATQLRFRRQALALKQYFSAHGVTVLLIDDNTAMEPDQQIHSIAHATITLEQLLPEYGSERRPSYVADSVILLRYFETEGEVRMAISVVKKRVGPHERTIREMRIDGGIRIGAPLREFRGVLSGTPHYRGSHDPLMR
jgi:circadian clock protein KaiC